MSTDDLNRLIDNYLAGKVTPDEKKLIDDFFSHQERKQTLQNYAPTEEMWNEVESTIQKKNLRVDKSTAFKIIWVALAFTAIIAILVFAYLYYPFSGSQEINWITSTAVKGQKSVITMQDGTRVYMNSGSSVSYPQVFAPSKREIFLSGEAFFEVARDESRPFSVTTGPVTTVALGTSFNINAFKETDIRVAVASGNVQVTTKRSGNGNPSTEVLLMPNQQAAYVSDRLMTSEIDISKVIAWTNYTLYFESATLAEVAERLERWYNVTIEFENERIRNCRLSGEYKDQSIHGVLGSIKQMHQVDYKFETQTKIIFHGKGCH